MLLRAKEVSTKGSKMHKKLAGVKIKLPLSENFYPKKNLLKKKKCYS
jgi:hypothetical protein